MLLWGMPTAAILLQVCFVYWFTAWLKASQSLEWWPEGTAIQGALNSYYAKPLGVALLAFPRLLRALTYSTLALETLGPVLALSPAWNGPARILAVGLFCGLHLGMALTLYLAHFPVVSVLGWLLFLPSCFWERWSPHRPDVSLEDSPQGFSWVINCVTALLLLFVFANNARPIHRLGLLARVLGLEQHWSMFLEPKKIDLIGFVAPGKTQDAREIDLLHHGRPVSLDSAAIVEAHAEPYWRAMWRKSDKDRAFYLPLAADDLCRGWNARAGSSDRVDGVEIYLVRRKASHERRDLHDVERVRLLEARCPGAGPGHSSVPLAPGGS